MCVLNVLLLTFDFGVSVRWSLRRIFSLGMAFQVKSVNCFSMRSSMFSCFPHGSLAQIKFDKCVLYSLSPGFYMSCLERKEGLRRGIYR